MVIIYLNNIKNQIQKIYLHIKLLLMDKQLFIDKMQDIGSILIQILKIKIKKVYKHIALIMYSLLYKIIKDNG
jgi:hypothetical protein